MTSRKQERPCVVCKNPFNSWGTSRDKCLQCDPIPVKLAKLYLAQIESGHELVRL